MTISTSDGKVYEDNFMYMLGQHDIDHNEEGSVTDKVAMDLDRRTPPPLPIVEPTHSIAPHNPNPPMGGVGKEVQPGQRLGFMPEPTDKNPGGDWPLGQAAPNVFKSLGSHMNDATLTKGYDESWKAFEGIDSLVKPDAFKAWLDSLPTGAQIEDRRNEPPEILKTHNKEMQKLPE